MGRDLNRQLNSNSWQLVINCERELLVDELENVLQCVLFTGALKNNVDYEDKINT